MRVLRIDYGADTFFANAKGWIERPGLVNGSERWRIVGAVECNNFGRVVREYTLEQVLADPGAIPWTHKNGTQRTFVRDFDHGAYRQWASPKHTLSRGPDFAKPRVGGAT